MKRLLLTAVAGVSLVAAATAFAGEGYITANVSLRAGPDSGYPAVMRLRAGTPVMIEGCVDGWSWCDVSLGEDRGWVSGAYLQEEYDGRRVLIRDYGVQIGVPIVSFVFGDYWDHYYRGRSWYGSRERWSHVQPRYYHGGSYGNSGGSYERSGGSYGHAGGSYSGTRDSTYRDTHRVDSRTSQPAYSSGYRSGDSTGSRHSGNVTTTQPTYQNRHTQPTYQTTPSQTTPSRSATQRQDVTTETRTRQSSVNRAAPIEHNANPQRSAAGEQHSAAGQQRAAQVQDRNVARAQQRGQNAAQPGSDHGNRSDKGNRNDKGNDKGNRDDKGKEQN
jgi:uncharacterized protein YraI